MTALSTSFATAEGTGNNASKDKPSAKRKKLHLLYLLNDILYHTKYRVNDASICGKIQPILVGLVGGAASFKSCPKHQKKIQDLLDLWQEKSYYSRDYIDKLREAVRNASEAGQHDLSNGGSGKNEGAIAKIAKSLPYVMPATHGDASTPWFDLPAGNLMPHIVPNSTRPINPDMIKPLHFVAGPADDRLVLAVKELLEDVEVIYGGEKEQDDRVSWDIDELGQPIILDEITGEVIHGEGYYGWSRAFCEKMKRRKKGLDLPVPRHDRRSRSRSSSAGGRKRRYSDDSASSDDEFRSRRRRRSYSSSRSVSPVQRGRNGRSRSRSRSYSKSPQPPPRSPDRAGFQSHQSRSFLPPPEALLPKPSIPPPQVFQQGFNPNFPSFQQQPLPLPPIPPPQTFQHGFNPNFPHFHQQPSGYQALPNYGAWPPPPPPPSMPYNQQQWSGPPPPPPPPPPPGPPPPIGYQYNGWQPPQQQQNGRGGYNNGGRGRGGYRSGRGW